LVDKIFLIKFNVSNFHLQLFDVELLFEAH
jgi:hypothetical protein